MKEGVSCLVRWVRGGSFEEARKRVTSPKDHLLPQVLVYCKTAAAAAVFMLFMMDAGGGGGLDSSCRCCSLPSASLLLLLILL